MTDDNQPPVFVRFFQTISIPDGAIASISGTIGLIGGFWIGLLSVPGAALDVPKTASEFGPEAAYLPIPKWAVPVTALILVVGLWLSWRSISPVVEEQLEADR